MVELSGRAPSAADAQRFLDRHASLSTDCPSVACADGGVTKNSPASARANQVTYSVEQESYGPQREIVTIKDEWFVYVVFFKEDSASPAMIADVSRVLQEQSLG